MLVIYSSYLLIMKKRGVTKGCTELGLFLYLICPASYVLSEIANLKYGIKSESCNSSRCTKIGYAWNLLLMFCSLKKSLYVMKSKS